MADLARCLRQLVATNDSESDASLLDRFVADRDGRAFAALVARHGPMVLAVCRRVLRHRQDAEDAFQATFLVLARRAEAVRPRSQVGNWLYGVAYRTALGARRVALARRAREAKAARAGEETIDETGLAPDLREALDRELAALPDVYRAALVACDLEGLTRREVAARLGWTEGTLSSRLSRARSLLARRLCRYALAVPAAGLAAVAGPAVVANELASVTVRLGTLVAAGEAVVAAPVAALMEGAMGTMVLAKFKTLAAALVVGCAVAMTSVAGWRADAVGAADPPKASEPPKRAAANPDKERIAELERERDRLLKEVAELRERLAGAEKRVVKPEEIAAELRAKGQRDLALAAERELAAQAEKRKAELDAARALEAAQPGRAPKAKTPPVDPNPLPPKEEPKPNTPGTSAPKSSNPLATTARAVVRVYPVGDLAGDEKEGEALAKVLRAAVEPKSWGEDAGVEYLPGRKVLVVRQTAKAHDEVAELLKLLQTQAAPGKK